MASVTQRIKKIKQPRGGYLPIKAFEVSNIIENFVLNENENINASIVGLSVDYLTRVVSTGLAKESFDASLKGASNIGKTNLAMSYLDKVKDLSDMSIVCAAKLAGFDVCYRAGIQYYQPVEDINPSNETIENIRQMTNMVLKRISRFDSKIFGFDFDGAYTDIIKTGDGDLITDDILWDIKVKKSKPNKDDTMQVLIYYLMGKRTGKKVFCNIKKLGFINPRRNECYLIDVSSIDEETVRTVESEVIGY